MRLLHIHSGNLYGGVERVLAVMARHRHGSRAEEGIEHAFAMSYDGRIAAEIRSVGCRVHILGAARASRPISVITARTRLAAICRHGRFDAVVAHSAWSLALLAPAATRPLVYYQHDLVSGRAWAERWARRTRPDLVVANSAFTAGTTGRMYRDAAAAIVHPPVELPAYRISSAARQSLRESFGTPLGCRVILQAGRFERLKGQRLLLDALARVDRRLPWFLWIAGQPQRAEETALRAELESRAESLGIRARVAFLGHVVDMPALMQSADIYSQTNSGPESFGLTFVEALHAGLPVLSTDLGGAREILGAEWGVLTAPTVEAAAAGLERLLTDSQLRVRLAEAGPLRARMLCDPRTQIDSFAAAVGTVTVLPQNAPVRVPAAPLARHASRP